MGLITPGSRGPMVGSTPTSATSFCSDTGAQPSMAGQFISRGGAARLARQAHNLEVGSSNLPPATNSFGQ